MLSRNVFSLTFFFTVCEQLFLIVNVANKIYFDIVSPELYHLKWQFDSYGLGM